MKYFNLNEITWVKEQFIKSLAPYNIEKFSINKEEEVYLLNDSLALYICIEAARKTALGHFFNKKYYSLTIEEVTYNDLGFKHNHTLFVKGICKEFGVDYINQTLPEAEGSHIIYRKFRGFNRVYWAQDLQSVPEYVDQVLPALHLRERYESWDGIHYYFIVIEFIREDNRALRMCAYTTQKPHLYINTFANRFIQKGDVSEQIRVPWKEFYAMMKERRNRSRKQFIENNMKYFFVEKSIREKDDVWRFADEVLRQANKGLYQDRERSTYIKPIYKWTSEELVLKLTRQIYKDCLIISQYKPFFLKSSFGGQMSYDVFIQDYHVAIEYQGKQHFFPAEFFGGTESFERQRIRDEEKRILSEEHGIKLVYINYDEVITAGLIKDKVTEAINQEQ